MVDLCSVVWDTLRVMAVSWIAVIALAATALGASIAPSEKQELEKSTCGRVWLTVHSPEVRIKNNRLLDALELNWDFEGCLNIPTQVGLFDDRPTSWNNAIASFHMDEEAGFIVTNITLGDGDLPAGWNAGPGSKGPHCLWPWIAAGDDNIDAYNCLKIQPTWMEDNADKIDRLHIGELAIAGTHNAGAWRFNTELVTVSRDRFVLCQDRSIWAQLVHGIRYFDLRIAYYDFYENEDERYWLNHNIIRVRPIVPLLQEIKMFLDHTKEVVFLDAHHFPVGFYDQNGSPMRSIHEGFISIVQRELGPHIAPYRDFRGATGGKGPTLQQLVQANKRLIFSYVDNSIVEEHKWLWPNLPHLWANTNNPKELFQYLDTAIALSPQPNVRSPMHSAMAETTPTVTDVLFSRGSLRENADLVNRKVTARLASVWRNRANIVSTDFFLANDVIDLSIMINIERGLKSL